jgi:hypothetical protein
MDLSNEENRQSDGSSARKERRRIRGLWIGFAVWVLILLNAIRVGPHIVANGFPFPIFVVGVSMDLLIAVVTFVYLRKAIRNQRSREKSQDQASRGNLDG